MWSFTLTPKAGFAWTQAEVSIAIMNSDANMAMVTPPPPPVRASAKGAYVRNDTFIHAHIETVFLLTSTTGSL